MNRPSARPAVDVTVGIPTRNRSQLLPKSIASVLAQTYDRFNLVVSDNASDDDTAAVVASFRDPRIEYRPLDSPVDRGSNFNRLIELADTEFVVLLGDDDELRPDHLSQTVSALRRWPTAGVAHTAYRILDANGDTLPPYTSPFETDDRIVFEPGRLFLERCMKDSGSLVSFSSAMFRKAALVGGGLLQQEDGLCDDFALLMRIAIRWDLVYLDEPLASVTAHIEADSSGFGSFTPNGFRTSRAAPEILYENRRRFLRDANLPEDEASRFARLTERRHRRDVVGHLSMRSDTGDGPLVLLRALGNEIRGDRHLALDPVTWRFVAGQLGGRRLRDLYRRC